MTPDGELDAQTWHGSGPILDSELAEEVRALLESAGAPVPDQLDHGTAVEALAHLWSAVLPRADGVDLRRLRDLEQQLEQLQVERSHEALDVLARIVGRLEAAPCSVSDLVSTIPQLICELGFSRGLISRVEDDVWTPELMYVVGDPESSEELTRVGQAAPQPLRPGMFETEVVRMRCSIVATNVQMEPWRSHATLAPASQTRSYVAAPVLSDGEVVGLLHAERYGQRRDVDELDRQVLTVLAEAVRIAMSRAALAEELELTQKVLASSTRDVGKAIAGVHRMPALRLRRAPGDDPNGLVVRTGPPGLPRDLSRRELEVLELLAAGKANGSIARQLGIAEGTVKQHVKHILRKLMVGSRAEAVARWFQAGGGA